MTKSLTGASGDFKDSAVDENDDGEMTLLITWGR
jgi:hypothetical protein